VEASTTAATSADATANKEQDARILTAARMRQTKDGQVRRYDRTRKARRKRKRAVCTFSSCSIKKTEEELETQMTLGYPTKGRGVLVGIGRSRPLFDHETPGRLGTRATRGTQSRPRKHLWPVTWLCSNLRSRLLRPMVSIEVPCCYNSVCLCILTKDKRSISSQTRILGAIDLLLQKFTP
jgi:hypothetical protein